MQSRRSCQTLIAIGSLLAALAVAAGAFGAHMLKQVLDPPMLAVFETAARYQMYHALGMIAVGLAGQVFGCPQAVRAGWCFAAGILLFCGSLYGVSLSGHSLVRGSDTDRRAGFYSGLESLGLVCLAREDVHARLSMCWVEPGYGLQSLVRFPLIDPHPPCEFTKVPSKPFPSLVNCRLSSWAWPLLSQRR